MFGKEYTIKEYISEYDNLDVTFESLYFKEVYTKPNGNLLILFGESILLKYEEEIKSKIISLKLTDQEYRKYVYNPKMLSFELYNTTEFWSLLLHANSIFSITQFNMNPVKVYNKSIIKTIDTILNLERDIIDNNEQYIKDKTIKTV